MIDESDIIRMKLSSYEMRYIYKMARFAEIGGTSHVRGDEARGEFLSEDQIVGQLGTYVGHRFMFGDARDYKVTRWYANRNPTEGDTGSDVTGGNIDFKTSLMRADKPALAYNMLVRPRERHDDWVYVQLLVESYNEKTASVLLLGWASTKMLPDEVADGGIFNGAYVLPALQLNPLAPLRWWFD